MKFIIHLFAASLPSLYWCKKLKGLLAGHNKPALHTRTPNLSSDSCVMSRALCRGTSLNGHPWWQRPQSWYTSPPSSCLPCRSHWANQLFLTVGVLIWMSCTDPSYEPPITDFLRLLLVSAANANLAINSDVPMGLSNSIPQQWFSERAYLSSEVLSQDLIVETLHRITQITSIHNPWPVVSYEHTLSSFRYSTVAEHLDVIGCRALLNQSV